MLLPYFEVMTISTVAPLTHRQALPKQSRLERPKEGYRQDSECVYVNAEDNLLDRNARHKSIFFRALEKVKFRNICVQ
jgi:hypothetical protein